MKKKGDAHTDTCKVTLYPLRFSNCWDLMLVLGVVLS